MKRFKQFLKFLIALFLALVVYAIVMILWATVSDYQPRQLEDVDSVTKKEKIQNEIPDTLKLITWNIGYGGLGEESDFFYDGGNSLYSFGRRVVTEKEYYKKNIRGIQDVLTQEDYDFYLLQEVDINSKRSHFNNQLENLNEILSTESMSFAKNYDVSYVPFPLFEPWNTMGSVEAGLATFSNLYSKESVRHSLPGSFDWPTNVFMLDRCLLVQKYNSGKDGDLVLINLHFSAYDEGGFIKKQQLSYLESLVQEEYAKGNYVVVAGDWNQNAKKIEEMSGLSEDWNVLSPEGVTTCRSLFDSYKKGETREKTIDYFLTSPNVQPIQYSVKKQEFKYSDHEPICLDFTLL